LHKSVKKYLFQIQVILVLRNDASVIAVKRALTWSKFGSQEHCASFPQSVRAFPKIDVRVCCIKALRLSKRPPTHFSRIYARKL